MNTPTTNPKLDDVLQDLVYDTPNHYGYPPDFEPDFKKAQQTILSDLLQLIGEDEEVTMTRERYEVAPSAKYFEVPKAHGMEANELRRKLREALSAYVGVES